MVFEPFLTAQQINDLKLQEAQSDKVQKRTPEQIEAIYTQGNNILVSASAGSGKTFVMVERILDKLKRGVAIQQLFISTFTVKAAGELKERLAKKLTEEISQTPQGELRQHLATQLADLPQADIGTMDAFTQKLVNHYGYLLGIAPHFRILTDKSEQDILKKEVFSQLFETYYHGEQGQVFADLVKNFSGQTKSTKAFQNLVDKIYLFTQSTSQPEAWLKEVFLKGYENLQTEADLPREVRRGFLTKLRQTAQQLEDVTNLPDYKQTTAKGEPTSAYKKHLEMIEKLYEWSAHPDLFPSLTDLAQAVSFLLPAGDDVTVKGVKYPIFKTLHQEVTQLKHLGTILSHQGEALPLLRCLQAFMLDFSKSYLDRKMLEGAFEFSDISHFAIEILTKHESIRKLYKEHYHEVMVDEYQDNNHSQEAMLDLLSNGHNRFMVGDIKQSIYRFRQADPQIFNQKFKLFQDRPDQGQLIILKENFRSQREVLEATNDLFSRLMDEAVGDIDYDDSHKLRTGSPKQELADPKNKTQVLIYDTDSQKESSENQESEEDTGLDINEVEVVIKEIIRLHNEEEVAFSDITLLVPSRTKNNGILAAFAQHGIPLVADGGEQHYLKSLEVQIMLDTLRSLNNPLNDYALVALLRSPMFRFDEDDLARISLQLDRKEESPSFYEKLLASLEGQGKEPSLIHQVLKEKMKTFENFFRSWRFYARYRSLHDLIWKIYNDKFYYDYVGALPNGEQRQANLYALALRADQFEKTGFKGLSRFIGMIDKVLASDNDLADVPLSRPKQAVQLMTIHKSKGLEFPYVFLLNLDKSFFSNKREGNSSILINRHQGVGIKLIADMKGKLETKTQLPRLRVSMDTLPYQINRREERLATLSESMRLLYVAMTRAEKKLYLVGKGSQKALNQKFSEETEQGYLPLSLREELDSFQDWFLAVNAAFGSRVDLAYDVSYIGREELSPEKIGRLAQTQLIQPEDLTHNRQSAEISAMLRQLEAVDTLNQRYAAAINLPTVRTPSQMKAVYQAVLDDEGLDIMDKDLPLPQFDLPDFSGEEAVTRLEVGSAIHELMQRLPLKGQMTKGIIESSLSQISATEAVKKSIQVDKILAFFETDLGQLLLTESDKVKRERPFAMLMKDPASQEDFVVRGIVDGYLVLEDRIVLFDYKTDRYKDPALIADRYRNQMNLYGEALKRSYGVNQVDKYLVLLGGTGIQLLHLAD